MARMIPNPPQGGIFHTFQGVAPGEPASEQAESSKSSSSGTSKRITTPHACAECKRRKIRCDGQQPCGQCLSSRVPKQCFYDKHRQRLIPSRKTLEALSQSLEECHSILNRLFPNHELHSLLPLPRHDLISLLEHADAATRLLSPPPTSPTLNGEIDSPICVPATGSLSSPEQISGGGDGEWGDGWMGSEQVPMQAGYVNALPLLVNEQTPYLGASSSINAALMVMLKIQPQLRGALAGSLSSSEMPHSFAAVRTDCWAQRDPQRIPWSWKGQTLVDSYFKRIHVMVPMLDEMAFRTDFLEGQRFDGPWLALLNTVFAMGSVVAMKSGDYDHVNYYNRAMEHLPLDAFGSRQIETVQALALIGGLYLHYTNRPDVANGVLGGSIRMASALGLPRECLSMSSSSDCSLFSSEARRRTWWCLFCLDTWASTKMGRPLCGGWGPAVSTQVSAEFGIITWVRDSAQYAGVVPLVENVKFCKIAAAIQDRLAIRPLLAADERYRLDAQLVNWYSNLPWPLRMTCACAEPLYIARCMMKWRYQNVRMLLYWPVLLRLASAKAQSSAAAEADTAAVERCRELARQTIEDMGREWTCNQMQGWNAAWFLYQAAMVPLVSVFWQTDSGRVAGWNRQIETVLRLLAAMEDWSLTARRSREVVWRLYEASRTMMHGQGAGATALAATLGAPLLPGGVGPQVLVSREMEVGAVLTEWPGAELEDMLSMASPGPGPGPGPEMMLMLDPYPGVDYSGMGPEATAPQYLEYG